MVNRTIHLGKTSLLGPYVGPGDLTGLTSPAMFCELRAMTTALAGSGTALIDIFDSSGANTLTIHSSSNGKLNTTEISGWTGTGTPRITKIYDQSGHGNHLLQATAANAPLLSATSSPDGTTYTINIDTTSKRMSTAGPMSGASTNPFVIVGVVKFIDTGTQSTYFADASSIAVGNHQSASNDIYIYNGGQNNTSPYAAGTFYAVQWVMPGSPTSHIIINGVDATLSAVDSGTGAWNSGDTVNMGSYNNAGATPGTFMTQGVTVYPINFDSTKWTAMNDSMHHATNGWNF